VLLILDDHDPRQAVSSQIRGTFRLTDHHPDTHPDEISRLTMRMPATPPATPPVKSVSVEVAGLGLAVEDGVGRFALV
jgi:hypothetical protein